MHTVFSLGRCLRKGLLALGDWRHGSGRSAGAAGGFGVVISSMSAG